MTLKKFNIVKTEAGSIGMVIDKVPQPQRREPEVMVLFEDGNDGWFRQSSLTRVYEPLTLPDGTVITPPPEPVIMIGDLVRRPQADDIYVVTGIDDDNTVELLGIGSAVKGSTVNVLISSLDVVEIVSVRSKP